MSLVSARYAESLFELAKSNNCVLSYKNQITSIKDIFLDANVDNFFKSYRINKDEKKELIKNYLKDYYDQYILNFIYVLIDKNRINNYLDIFNDFIKLCNDYLHIIVGTIETPHMINNELIEKLEKALSNEEYQIELKPKINESLISGFKINLNSHIIDNSLKNKIDSLKEELLRKDGAIWN